MKYYFESAFDGDVPELEKLERLCFPEEPLSSEHIYEMLNDTERDNYLLTDEFGRIVGAYNLQYDDGEDLSCARLYSIAVHPMHQERGLGKMMLDHAESIAKIHGKTQMNLETRKDNEKNLAFYKKNGYNAFGFYIEYYADKTDAIRMKKTI